MSEQFNGPWAHAGNSWQYSTVYDIAGRPVCQLDLEDWGVTEDNQDDLMLEQDRYARLISAAPELLAVLERIRDSYRGYIPDFIEAVNAAIDKAKVTSRVMGNGETHNEQA